MSTPEDTPAPTEEELPGEHLLDAAVEPDAPEVREPLITTDQALTLEDTEDLAERHGLTVVLIAGEYECGKTTLLVALWNSLLNHGAIADAHFAGSRTALGFERRAWLARLACHGEKPDTDRTHESENGFMHIRLAAHGRLHEVLLSDVAGETFKQVRHGTPFKEKIEWLDHANLALFLVDGEALADNGLRSSELSNTRRLIGQLRESGAAPRVAVILAKADLLTPEVREKWDHEAQVLLERARQIDKDAALLEITARPPEGMDPEGLDDVLGVILEPHSTAAVVHQATRSDRMIGRVT
ncbi:MAG: hypothetical protein WB709_10660 [Solirubrobacteraceae bacterium]